VPADFLDPFGISLNDAYLIVHAVDDLAPGTYFYHGDDSSLERLRAGNYPRTRRLSRSRATTGPRRGGEHLLLAALDPIFARFGNRGYRAVQLEAGMLNGKVYLAAYALGLGATGLTFYDDDVIEFFSPHASDKSTIFLMTVGHPRRRTGI
jgi:SagB-type dehydrogenase family enzyme